MLKLCITQMDLNFIACDKHFGGAYWLISHLQWTQQLSRIRFLWRQKNGVLLDLEFLSTVGKLIHVAQEQNEFQPDLVRECIVGKIFMFYIDIYVH